jgi:hypothetical protein
VLTVGAARVEDLERLEMELRALMKPIPGKVVFCADLRRAAVQPGPAADRLVEIMRRSNPRLERTAQIIGDDTPTLLLQAERLVRIAGGERRLFRDPGAAAAWLGEVLDAPERERLRQFLAIETIPAHAER